MRVVVVHDGPPSQALVLTSVVGTLLERGGATSVTVSVAENCRPFFEHWDGVTYEPLTDVPPVSECDLLVDYGGSDRAVDKSLLFRPVRYRGLIPRDNSEIDEHAFRGLYLREQVQRNLFQLMYGVAGLRWEGQGYRFRYYPKTRKKPGRVGIAVRDRGVRAYVEGRLRQDADRTWKVLFRQNVLKQFDEVNAADSVVTDDEFVLHAALCLRRHVEYLVYEPPNVKPEFFGNGCVHLVPAEFMDGGK